MLSSRPLIFTSATLLRRRSIVSFRRFATDTSKKSTMTEAERETILREANEKMKSYHINRPPIEVIMNSKRRSRQRDAEHRIQLMILVSFLTAFLATPFLGHKIASDEEWRKRFIPSWYDFSIEKPKSEWSREDLHEQLVEMQKELHERAMRGEFTPENLEKMRRHFAGVDPENDEHGWGQIHPGVDEDEDIEED